MKLLQNNYMLHLNKKKINEILTLIDHVRRDIGFDAGGTFGNSIDGNSVDKKEVKMVENAIETLKHLCIALNDGK